MGKKRDNALNREMHTLFVPDSGTIYNRDFSFIGLIEAVSSLASLYKGDSSPPIIEAEVRLGGVIRSHNNDGIYMIGDPSEVLSDLIDIEPLFFRRSMVDDGLVAARSRILSSSN